MNRAQDVRPIKVLLVVTEGSYAGGASGVVRTLAVGLRSRGFQPVLAFGGGSSTPKYCEDPEIPGYRLPSLARTINPVRDAHAYGELCKVVQREKPDVLHGHSFKAGALVRVVGRRRRIPTVYTMHGWGAYYEIERPLRWTWMGMERLLSAKSEVAYVCTHDLSMGRRAGIPGGLVIPVAPQERGETRETPLECLCGEPVRILIVARLAPQKDPLGTLRTLALVRDADPGLPWSVTWVGGGPLKQRARDEAARLGLTDRIRWVEETDDIAPYYQSAHLFLLLSGYEGAPLSIVEALRARLLVVASAVGGVPEMLSGSAGILVPFEAGQSERAGVLLKVLRSLDCFGDMRSRGGLRAAEYSASRMIERYATLYSQLARGEGVWKG